jgi:hypothetical protein
MPVSANDADGVDERRRPLRAVCALAVVVGQLADAVEVAAFGFRVGP